MAKYAVVKQNMIQYLKSWLLLSLLTINQDKIVGQDTIDGVKLQSEIEPNIEFLYGDQPGFSHDQYYEYAMQSQPNLGVHTMFSDKFPTLGGSPIGLIDVSVFFGNLCSQNSKLKQIVANFTQTMPITCNGMISTVGPLTLESILGGENVTVSIEKKFERSVQSNGNQIITGSGMIMQPAECKGAMIVRVAINLANSQYACVTTGLTGQSTLFNLILVSAPCESYCWLSSGSTSLATPINVLGPVVTPPQLTPVKKDTPKETENW